MSNTYHVPIEEAFQRCMLELKDLDRATSLEGKDVHFDKAGDWFQVMLVEFNRLRKLKHANRYRRKD